MDIAASTDLGRVREGNEDSLLVIEPAIIAVADGMGGHAAGEVASQQALEVLKNRLADLAISGADGEQDLCQALTTAVAAANRHVYQLSREAGYAGMGTTLTVAHLCADKVVYAHVGDSRLYLYRAKKLQQITSDHSLVAEMLRHGYLTEAEAAHHPRRNVITRAIGTSDEVKIDCGAFSWQSGDAVLLCTDGLTTMLDDAQIEAMFAAGVNQPQAFVQQLIDTANELGGKDNITVICAVHKDAGI